jgi:TatD DNase family protein
MLETDAPYLLPRTIRPRPRSRRNEPGLLPWVLVETASRMGLDAAELAVATSANARRLFAFED